MSLEAASVVRIIKLEDRKRASDLDDSTSRPLKRQATMATNGTDNSVTFGAISSPWQVELDTYQKDALVRNMREIRREKALLELQLADNEKRAKFHDEHLRLIDAWLMQVVDNFKLIVGDVESIQPMATEPSPFVSGLLTADNEAFKQHLSLRATSINDTLSALCSKAPQANPNTKDMQIQLSRLLANEKQHVVELQRVMAENKQLNERLDTAAYRYMVAEKKFDKSKSTAASMLEIQNVMQSQSGPGETSNMNGSGLNGLVDATGPASEEAETARRAATAMADKRKEQLDVLELENQKLTEELTSSNARLNSLSDDDYAKTELFKAMKSQYEDVIKKINNLEAINVGLREEAQKLQAERTAYRLQVDEECRTSCSEAENQLAKMDLDLQRIRAERDLVLQEKATLEVSQTKHDLTLREIQALNSAAEDRLKALESEVQRLRLQIGESHTEDGSGNDLRSQSEEDLRKEVASLRVQASMLNTELSSMQSAFTKSRAQAIKKSAEISSLEEQFERTREQKQRLEGNRFSERTLLDTKKLECDNLRRQSHKSGEIISQLKDAENRTRELCTNLEKQLTEHRDNLYALTEQNRFLQQRATETKLMSDGVQSQVVELKTILASKDLALVSASHSQRAAEAALEGMQVQLSDAKKKMEEWREKAHANPTDEIDMLRRVAYCGACNQNLKDTCITTCGHVVCGECVKERIQSRSRKCPHCLKPFGGNDYRIVHMV